MGNHLGKFTFLDTRIRIQKGALSLSSFTNVGLSLGNGYILIKLTPDQNAKDKTQVIMTKKRRLDALFLILRALQ